MLPFLEFLHAYAGLMASALVAVVWFGFWRPPGASWLGLAAFPFLHFRRLWRPADDPAVFPITAAWLWMVTGLIQNLFYNPYTYLINSGVVSFYLWFATVNMVLKLRSALKISALAVPMLLFIGHGIWQSIQAQSYQPANDHDFYAHIMIFSCALYIVISLGSALKFIARMESFFICFGIAVFSFLQILSTILLYFDFEKNYFYSSYTIFLLQFFWLVSVPWMRRLRYKLT